MSRVSQGSGSQLNSSITTEQNHSIERRVSPPGTVSHHPYFYVPAYDDEMKWLFFASNLSGTIQAHAEDRRSGEIVQITRRSDLNEWSIHPSHDGRYLYYSAGSQLCRTAMESMTEEVVADFSQFSMLAAGMVGAGMGTLSVSREDAWVTLPVRAGSNSRLYVIETATGLVSCVAEGSSIFHPQFHPNDSTLIRYSGPHTERMWVVNRDGTDHKLAYTREASRKEWVVHESWIPGTRELLAVDWPHTLFRVSIDTGERRNVATFNSWHPLCDRSGRRIVCDTLHPDRGIYILALDGITSESQFVCESNASSRGDHWRCDHCPYDDGPIQVYAPQHTHPHPAFSPDGEHIVYTTDRSGSATVFEVKLQS